MRLAIGLILNFLGGVLWLYYYDKTAATPHRATRKVFLPRWVFYAGVVCFCVGFYLIIVSMMK